MVNPHLDNGKPWGGSTSKSTVSNPYKQAAESMMSAGISSVSGSTTSDDKGKQAKKIQEDYKSNQENQNKFLILKRLNHLHLHHFLVFLRISDEQ